MSQGYRYFNTPYPTPDTGNYAFDAGMTLPLFQVQGAGLIPRGQLAPRFNSMVMNQSTVYLRDVANGGWIAGQLIGQPLSPPASTSNSTG